MAYHWLSWAMLALGFASALAILAAELRAGRRTVMTLVHPITALYWGPVWLRVYRSRGGGRWRDVAHAVSHCGAGCTLGDIAGEWLVLTLGIDWFGRVSGHTLAEEYLLDFLLAWTLGIGFQYATTGSLRRAIQADTLSIVAFQVGLFGWMAIFMLAIWPHGGIRIDSPGYWFQMQIGMILGFLTSWPVNRLLLARGVKEPMG